MSSYQTYVYDCAAGEDEEGGERFGRCLLRRGRWWRIYRVLPRERFRLLVGRMPMVFIVSFRCSSLSFLFKHFFRRRGKGEGRGLLNRGRGIRTLPALLIKMQPLPI